MKISEIIHQLEHLKRERGDEIVFAYSRHGDRGDAVVSVQTFSTGRQAQDRLLIEADTEEEDT